MLPFLLQFIYILVNQRKEKKKKLNRKELLHEKRYFGLDASPNEHHKNYSYNDE